MKEKLEYAIKFAEFSIKTKIPPPVLAQLVDEANKSFMAYLRANTPDAYSERIQSLAKRQYGNSVANVVEIAKTYGYTVTWDEFDPILVSKDGHREKVPID